MNTKSIDINCDLGEGKTQHDCERDALLMPYISRCNIACGGHAGNAITMKLSIKNAIEHNIKIGAHPGYPDKENFGRHSIEMSFRELKSELIKQIGELQNNTFSFKTDLNHIKFHGALYNDIENNPSLANQIANFISHHYPKLLVVCLADGHLLKSCRSININTLEEAFIDRRYQNNGKLSPRTTEGSVINQPQLAIKQALSIANQQPIKTISQQWLTLKANTLCLHGDNVHSLEVAKNLNQKLLLQGFQIK